MQLGFPKLLALVALSVGALSLPPLEILQRLDRVLYDLWTRVGAPEAPSDLILIELPDPSAQAGMIERARWQSARMVVSTIEETVGFRAGKLETVGPIAVASASMPILRETAWRDGGFLWPRADFDGVLRFERPHLGDTAATPSLALAAAEALAAKPAVEERSDRFGRRWLRFYAPDGLRPETLESIRLKPDALTDKVVVLGAAGAPTHSTPVGALSMAEILAHALAGYRDGAAVRTGALLDLTGWAAAVLWLVAIAALPMTRNLSLALPSIGMASLLGLGATAFLAAGAWIPVAGPALLVAGMAGLALDERRRQAPEPARSGLPTLLDGRRLIARGELADAWRVFSHLPMNRDLLGETYDLGCALAERGEPELAADAFHRVAQADASYRDVARRLVAACETSHGRLPEQPPKPSELGRYEILGLVGSGAMGVVYLGRDPSINRIVAIKAFVLEKEFEPGYLEEARERFNREAEIAGRLNHPDIVTIYDIGEQEGVAYIAMEYVRGTHLSHHAAPSRLLPVRQVLSLVARVAMALDYAHRENVVHRDIKPANIMYDSATDSLKITDFGVARLMDVSRTRTGVILGTPSYMSPEQLQGENVNGHTDLFALGVSLYQLLTGYLPFRGTSMTELMFVIANEPHIPVTAIRTELPGVLDGILDRALAKDPEARYSDGAAFAQALRAAAGI
jgi:predicted Ser/Thr protein kinase